VVLIIDYAPWHRGRPIDDASAEHPHLELYRLPSYSLDLNAVERFWRVLQRQATHNRLFGRLFAWASRLLVVSQPCPKHRQNTLSMGHG
jgi:transposase